MEPFKKTTISPGNLDLILSNHNAIKLIIIKNNIEVVRIADNLAINSTGGERKVIWFPDGLPKKYVTDFNINTTTTIAFTGNITQSLYIQQC